MENEVKIQEVKPSHTNRILKISGITMVSAGLLLAGCRDNDADSSNFQD
jgi:hypothetical protein